LIASLERKNALQVLRITRIDEGALTDNFQRHEPLCGIRQLDGYEPPHGGMSPVLAVRTSAEPVRKLGPLGRRMSLNSLQGCCYQRVEIYLT
jgi:hypothetical protein